MLGAVLGAVPTDAFYQILPFLSNRDLARLALTGLDSWRHVAGSSRIWRPRCAQLLRIEAARAPSLRRFEAEVKTTPTLLLYSAMVHASHTQGRIASFVSATAPIPMAVRLDAAQQMAREVQSVRYASRATLAQCVVLLALASMSFVPCLGCGGLARSCAASGAGETEIDGSMDFVLLSLMVVASDFTLIPSVACVHCQANQCAPASGPCALALHNPQCRTVLIAYTMCVVFSCLNLAQRQELTKKQACDSICVPAIVHMGLLLALPLIPCNVRVFCRLRALALQLQLQSLLQQQTQTQTRSLSRSLSRTPYTALHSVV